MKRIDIISDTHGRLSSELLRALDGTDLVIHAGDITSEEDWAYLCERFDARGALGNNDGYRSYVPQIPPLNRFSYEGLRFAVAHYREDLPVREVDVAVCGHTHRARIRYQKNCMVINPGSASYPRGARGPTMVRLFADDGRAVSAKIVDL